MPDSFGKFVKISKENFKYFRDSLRDLKAQAKKDQKIAKLSFMKPKKHKGNEMTVQFSLLNIAQATLVVLALIALSNFLVQIGEIILIFFISVLFSAALAPTVRSLEKYRIPRSVSVLGIFLILIFLLGFFVSQLVPLIVTQLLELAKSLSGLIIKIHSGELKLPFPLPEGLEAYLRSLIESVDRDVVAQQIQGSLEGLADQLQLFAGDTFKVILRIFNGILNFFLVLVLTFFLVVNEQGVHDFFVSLFPSKHGAYIVQKIHTIQEKVGYWLRGQVVLMCLMFVFVLTGLLILGVENAFTLAMMAGIAELLPVVGGTLSAIPAVLVALNASPWLALWVLIMLIVLQQIEGNVFVPLVMRKAVGLSPIVIIPAMFIGLKTLGIVGMILAIPVATTLSIFVREYAEKEK